LLSYSAAVVRPSSLADLHQGWGRAGPDDVAPIERDAVVEQAEADMAAATAWSVRPAGRKRPGACGAAALLEYLRGTGVVPPEPSPLSDSPRQRLLAANERYLSGERSLSPPTIAK
jgi:hypothetical protein